MDNILVHYGVKGMRWGVRKDNKLSPYDKALKLGYNYRFADHHTNDKEKIKSTYKKFYDYVGSKEFEDAIYKKHIGDYDRWVVKYGQKYVDDLFGSKDNFQSTIVDSEFEKIWERADNNAYYKLGYKDKSSF